jgi:hypothetical protein
MFAQASGAFFWTSISVRDTVGNMEQPADRSASTSRSKQLKAYAMTFLAGLLIAAIPLGISLIRTQGERETSRQQLRLVNLEINLASAAVMARHGDYTAARDAANRYFSDARAAVDGGDEMLTPAQSAYLQSALAERDALIALLSRGDPAGVERSTTMYVEHRKAFPR